MAICTYCKQDMLTADGCVYQIITDLEGASYSREKVGDEGWYAEGQRCGDCGALFGHYHHYGCDVEKCPKCRKQLISCDCHFKKLVKNAYMPI